ncbi:MAG TPA: ABC transporter ATP-binding protein [Anaeromyxobacteraceae bacterium]|nr:ABC transporter ATP-binding protein [Anaeromyxobacteraceae bacterium]
MASLTLDHVSKVYEQKGLPPTRAVRDVSMRIEHGEIIGLVGSSGCGKTSTLRMIAGFESVSEGTIRIGETAINKLKAADRNVAMAFEGYALYPPLRVADNISFSLLRNKMPKSRADAKVKAVAELLEITDILDLYPPTLSGGQQQRVSLARALVRAADVFLLDEPMSQLEPHLRAKLRARIKDYLIENKMTSVFVTHDQTEAMALADRIAVMSEGVLQQFGSPAALKERPSNLFVAGFIGEPPMNLLEGEIRLEGGARRLAVLDRKGGSSFSVKLPEHPHTAPLQPRKRVHLGLRPHKIAVAPTGDAGGERVSGTVVSSQWLGDQTYLGVEIGASFLIVVADRSFRAANESSIVLGLPLEALHIFDSESGAAVFHGSDLDAQP